VKNTYLVFSDDEEGYCHNYTGTLTACRAYVRRLRRGGCTIRLFIVKLVEECDA
jgi:hypothetical protein